MRCDRSHKSTSRLADAEAQPSSQPHRGAELDAFLRAWLAALKSPIEALSFQPLERLIGEADTRLHEGEGHTFEKLVAVLYQERSRKEVGDFPLTEHVSGWWDRAGTGIDLVVVDGAQQRIRFGTCKRSANRLRADLSGFEGHVQRFLNSRREGICRGSHEVS